MDVQTNYVIISMLLALMPLASYYIQYFVAKKNKRLDAFRNFLPVKYMDWVFIPFNFLWLYVVNITLAFNIYLIIFTLIGALILLLWWAKEDPKNSKWEDYSFRKEKFRAEGWVHGIYALFQGFLVVVFLFSQTGGMLALVEGFLLLIYFIIGIVGIHKLHKKFSVPDLFYIIVGIAVTLIKLFLICYR
jgi:hypothetical protein